MKYQGDDLVTERRKPRRGKLCSKLENNEPMRALHDRCHFIAWLSKQTGETHVSVYRKEVCHCAYFPAAGLKQQAADTSSRLGGETFADRFFGLKRPPCSVSREELENYLEWVLTETTDTNVDNLELLIKTDRIFGVMQPRSFRDVLDWLDAQTPRSGRSGPGI